MADSIVDGRTSLTTNDATGLDDHTGAPAGSNNLTRVEGANSQSVKESMSVGGLLFDNGTAVDWSGNVFYLWWNNTTPGLMDTLASGGVRLRFCGNTVTDWFEIYIAGSDTYSGGFTMTVADIDEARAQATGAGPGGVGGTAPATTAIRYVGIVWDVPGNVPGNVDNCYLDAMWRLPANTPGIRVEGLNGGSSDWTWQDIVDAADVKDVNKAWGTIERLKNGTISVNTPVRFGVADSDGHGFADTNENVGWEDALVPDGFYGIEVIGDAAGTTDFVLGLKSGTGDDATGSQGGSITSGGPRWFLTLNDADVDSAQLYGMTLAGAGVMVLDDPAIEVISCIILDCSSALVSNAGDFLRNTIVAAATADGVAFITTDDLTDIVFCSFSFSDGHGVELTTPRVASQASKGNRFTGYGTDTSNDAAIYNNSAGAVTVTLSDGATSGEHTVREGASASTLIVSGAVTHTVTVLDGVTPVESVRVLVWCTGTGGFPSEDPISITRSGATATVDHTAHGMATSDEVRIEGAAEQEYNGIFTIAVTGVDDYTYTVSGSPATPATGSPTSSLVLINGLTNASGVIADTRSYPSNQDITGRAVKGTSSPVYVPGDITGTVDSAAGLPVTVPLVRDE